MPNKALICPRCKKQVFISSNLEGSSYSICPNCHTLVIEGILDKSRPSTTYKSEKQKRDAEKAGNILGVFLLSILIPIFPLALIAYFSNLPIRTILIIGIVIFILTFLLLSYFTFFKNPHEKTENRKNASKASANLQDIQIHYCHKCGNKIVAGSHFCNKCGTKLSE